MKWAARDGRYTHKEFVCKNKEKQGDDFKFRVIGKYIVGEFSGVHGYEYYAIVRKKWAGFWSDEYGSTIRFDSLESAMAVVFADMASEVCK